MSYGISMFLRLTIIWGLIIYAKLEVFLVHFNNQKDFLNFQISFLPFKLVLFESIFKKYFSKNNKFENGKGDHNIKNRLNIKLNNVT